MLKEQMVTGAGGDYSREVIISNSSIKGEQLLREAIIRENTVIYHATGLSLHTSYPENAA